MNDQGEVMNAFEQYVTKQAHYRSVLRDVSGDRWSAAGTPSAPGQGPKDPRDPVGQNPTGNPRKSSAGKRRQEERKGK
jgi:hypothetical protein